MIIPRWCDPNMIWFHYRGEEPWQEGHTSGTTMREIGAEVKGATVLTTNSVPGRCPGTEFSGARAGNHVLERGFRDV